jgi:hypothetical protein
MLTALTQWIVRRPAVSSAYADAFVASVEVESVRTKRDPQLMRFILLCWALIAVKHVAVIWAVHHYHMPFHQLIVNFPTWLIGTVATALYLRRTH